MEVEGFDEIKEEERKSPFKYIIAIFLLLLVVLMIVPYYGIKNDPNPSNVISLNEVMKKYPRELDLNEEHTVNSIYDFKNFVNKTDPLVRGVALEVVKSGCEGYNNVCYSKALYYFVRDNFNYVGDPLDYEYVETVRESLYGESGDCENHALILASLHEAIGIKSRLVIIPGHAFLQVYLPEALKSYKEEGDWIGLDATCKDCEYGEIPYKILGKYRTYIRL